ncbi:hypothetical protein LSAT2_004643, partial [Lamellibrachia satsuma]
DSVEPATRQELPRSFNVTDVMPLNVSLTRNRFSSHQCLLIQQ